jgi:glycerol-3-phosphate dehydrogenase (NAD(P)+)
MGAIAVIGAGSWGTTLANLLAENGQEVTLWVFEEDLARTIERRRENEVFLPGIRLADGIRPTSSLAEAFSGKEILLCVAPSHVVRQVFSKGQPYLREGALIISATKGLEDGTFQTMTQVLDEVAGPKRAEVVCISGPSFAMEVSRKIPTAVTVAGPEASARKVQELFARPYFRIYTSTDRVGVELGGAVKNVMAIAAGASDGLGFGHSSRAALITRGLAEMIRLGVRMGAAERTFSGLAGLGDLVLTCTGDLSRNRTVGMELGKGRRIAEILAGMKMVAEGVRTAKALWELARKVRVEMPITEKVYEILYTEKNPREAVAELMSRNLRSELEGA